MGVEDIWIDFVSEYSSGRRSYLIGHLNWTRNATNGETDEYSRLRSSRTASNELTPVV